MQSDPDTYKIFDFPSGIPRRLGSTSVNVQLFSVGHPGLDLSALGVFPECPGTFVSVQICWSDEGECPSTFTDVLSRLNSWLDQGSFQGQVTAVEFRGADGEVFELRVGEE
jgi:hypothetical protein